VSTVLVTQTKSVIGQTQRHQGTLRSLGLGRIGKSAEHKISRELEGKLRHVAHLVSVTPLERKDA
jgi:large subunit ribosomal protein L30